VLNFLPEAADCQTTTAVKPEVNIGTFGRLVHLRGHAEVFGELALLVGGVDGVDHVDQVAVDEALPGQRSGACRAG
jgi:hypothetical protein